MAELTKQAKEGIGGPEKCLNIVCALACEAKPLIDWYKLKKANATAFPLYRSESGRNINLVVSGIGMTNSATAVGWLGALTTDFDSLWLNIGTAGQADLDIGEAVWVHCAKQEAYSRNYFPPMVAKWPAKTVSVLSCNLPSADYPETDAVDMEAYAFFNAATQFSNSECVQSLKVISDNRRSGLDGINAAMIGGLIEAQVPSIIKFADSLFDLLPEILKPVLDNRLIEKFHCTVSQRRIFDDLMQRCGVLGVEMTALNSSLSNCGSTAEVLELLKQSLRERAPEPIRVA